MVHGGDIYTDGKLKGKQLLDFSSNVNPLPVSLKFLNNLHNASELLPLYPDIKYRELRKDLQTYISNSNHYFSDHTKEETAYIPKAESILVGNGASEILDLTIRSLHSVTIVVPSFVEYEDIAEKHGLKINYAYLDEEFEYDYDEILLKIKDTDGLIIGNPNNPNGNIIDHCRFLDIMDYCEKNNKTIIVDEAFIEFVLDNNQSLIKYAGQYKCLVIIRAITKFYSMAGIRFGYGITENEKVLSTVEKYQNPWSVNCFAELAVKYALSDERFIEASVNWLLSERQWMSEHLEKVSYINKVYESNGNYFLCSLKGITSTELCNKLKKRNILIRNCNNYKGLDERFVRIALKDTDKNEVILEELNNIQV